MRRKRCAGKEECTKPEIWLNAKLFERSIIFLDNILIHELCHYACWYYGWEMEDGSTQFENLLKKTGASSNSGNRWDAKNKVYIPVYDGRRMKHYEYMFMTYRRTGKSPPCAHLSVVS